MMWALLAALAMVTVAEFAYIRWSFQTAAKREQRELAVLRHRAERASEDVYWDHLRPYEAANALLISMQRAIEQHPERIADLLTEPRPNLKAVS